MCGVYSIGSNDVKRPMPATPVAVCNVAWPSVVAARHRMCVWLNVNVACRGFNGMAGV